jgi:competence protein ComEC
MFIKQLGAFPTFPVASQRGQPQKNTIFQRVVEIPIHTISMSDNTYFRPAIPLLIFLICGILFGSYLAGYEIWAATAAIICTGFCLRQISRKKNARIIPIVFFISLGYLSVQPWVSPRLPANHILHYTDTHRWDITGRIADEPLKINNRTRFHLQVTSLSGDGQTRAVSGKLRVTALGNIPDLSAGDWVQCNSRIRSLTNFKNPGGFDYKKYMAFKGIRASTYIKGDTLVVIDKHPLGGFFQIIESGRSTFSGLIEKSGQTQVQGVLKALIIGDRSQISTETRQAFNRAGVGHLLAISGLHIGIVATVAFGFFHQLMTRFKPFLWRAWTRKGAALLSLLPVFAYGMMAGFTPSTQRAVIMVSIFLLTFLFEREQDPLNTLALAALIILVADPPSLFSISFQLSFTAVFAIIYGFSWVQKRTAALKTLITGDRRLRFISRLISFFLVSFFAVCGSLPLVAVYFNQISLVGLAANFIVVPLVGFLAIPLGLVALFVSPLSTTAAFWCIQASSGILTIALAVVQFFADLPFAAVKTFTPGLLEIGCFYVLCWALLNLHRQPRLTAGKPGTGTAVKSVTSNFEISLGGADSGLGKFQRIFRSIQVKRLSQSDLAKAALVLVLVTLAADTCYWLHQRFGYADLRVTVIDVGHGSSSLLEFPGGYTMLIDGGGFADNSAFDVGAAIVAPLLWRKKIRTVDALILTHPNSDHLNGLIYIARHFHVKKVWTNSEAQNTLGYKNFMEVIKNKRIDLPSFADMSQNHWINGVKLDFLYPPTGFLKRREKEKWRNTNNNSLVVKVSMGSTSFLFPGDIMAAAEKELVGIAGRKLNSTVLIAPHHGSRSSSSTVFLGEVNPDVIVISSGRQNRFKLPHPATLNKYQQHGSSIFRTDLNGAVSLSTDGQQLEIKPFIAF